MQIHQMQTGVQHGLTDSEPERTPLQTMFSSETCGPKMTSVSDPKVLPSPKISRLSFDDVIELQNMMERLERYVSQNADNHCTTSYSTSYTQYTYIYVHVKIVGTQSRRHE